MDFSNHPLNNNVNVNKQLNTNVNVEATAYKLTEKLSDAHSFRFFCKVARSLPENVIWSEVEVALTKRTPARYFTSVCNTLMSK